MLMERGVVRRYRARQVLFRAGDPADGLYVVIAGRVRVARETEDRVVLLHHETAGGVLGEIPAFAQLPFPATATALEPTECLKLSQPVVRRLIRESAPFVDYALARLAKRSESLLRRIDELTATTVVSRVARALLARELLAREVLERADGRATFGLGSSQAAFAEEMGTAREVLVRALRTLVSTGAIARAGRSRFRVADRQVMLAIASRGIGERAGRPRR